MDYDTYENYDGEGKADTFKRILIAFVLGGLVSSLITLFITPTTGNQARRAVKDTMDDVRSMANQAKDTMASAKSRVMDAPSAAKSTVKEAKTTAKRRASKLKQVAGDVLEEQKESLQHGAEEAIDVLKSG